VAKKLGKVNRSEPKTVDAQYLLEQEFGAYYLPHEFPADEDAYLARLLEMAEDSAERLAERAEDFGIELTDLLALLKQLRHGDSTALREDVTCNFSWYSPRRRDYSYFDRVLDLISARLQNLPTQSEEEKARAGRLNVRLQRELISSYGRTAAFQFALECRADLPTLQNELADSFDVLNDPDAAQNRMAANTSTRIHREAYTQSLEEIIGIVNEINRQVS
jgi:hypothetical protein